MMNANLNTIATERIDFNPLVLKVPEDKLVAALKAGNFAAFNYLYHKYSAAMHGTILMIVNQQETAEDIMQDVFLKINKNILAYQPEKGRLFTWMLNMARNTAIDHIRLVSSRGRNRSEDIDECVKLIDSCGNTQTNTDLIGLSKLVGRLSQHEQELIHLTYYKGMTHPEIAEFLEIPLGTVKTRLRNSMLKLRKQFS